jgi:AAA+ superfamily predicted ATPase
MSGDQPGAWVEANQRYISAALDEVRAALEEYTGQTSRALPGPGLPDDGIPGPDRSEGSGAPLAPAAAPPWPEGIGAPALQALCETFGLSPFERAVLLLCAGMELDGSFSSVCARAQGDPARGWPTFGLALAALPGAHWTALTPEAPLRRWRLVEVGAGGALTASPLRIDERILHYLAGVQHLDERLLGFVEPIARGDDIVPSQRAVSERIVRAWSASPDSSLPVVQLCGGGVGTRRAVAAEASAALGLHVWGLRAEALPAGPQELDSLARLWEREAAMAGRTLLLESDEGEGPDPARDALLTRFAEGLGSPLVLSSRERRIHPTRVVITFDVARPTPIEQRSVWRSELGDASPDAEIDVLVGQFNLDVAAIREACVAARASELAGTEAVDGPLWEACRIRARPRLDDLAQRIDPAAGWDDIVLPEPARDILRQIALHARHRPRVYGDWGFEAKSTRGLGISALFVGPSGTGKTMAAEVLAGDLRLDLYRIDLSQVVSKYIGETEKNLRRVFDAAEDGGAVLLFDEADALFGKRSEVRDSHDRYANIEVSYLLQRMEAYRGLAILTTNMKEALDTAFLRRIRFVVHFPFPDTPARAEIWRRVFPEATPTERLDMERLSRLNLAGGNIRNIALNAAFLAADAREPVRMSHLLRAARSEYAKLEKPLTEAEIGGWA